MRQFYLFKNKKGIYIAEILDPKTGRRVCLRNTGQKDKQEAVLIVSDWLRDGIPARKRGRPCQAKDKFQSIANLSGLAAILKATETLDSSGALEIAEALRQRGLIDFQPVKLGPGNIKFLDFVKNFWDYEKSPYIKEKLAHGQSIGKKYCYDRGNDVNTYYSDYFRGRTLASITRQDIKEFSLKLTERRIKPDGHKGHFTEKFSASTINRIINVARIPLKWAYMEKLISINLTEGLMRFSGTTKKRGVLSTKEAESIFALVWDDKRAYIGNLLACTTGMRIGEVLAVRKENIGDNFISVKYSWAAMVGLKCPKNGETRKVPLLPQVREKLLELSGENPHGPDGFVFFSLLPDKPIDGKIMLNGLIDACKKAGINPKERNIVFHSWRHTWVTLMAEKLALEKIARVSGHKTKAMAEHYGNHILEEALEATAQAGAEVFGKIIKFKGGAA